MKKTYINPAMKVVKVQTQHIMAGSLGDGPTPNSFTLGDAPTTTATSGNLSKGGSSLWDDEE